MSDIPEDYGKGPWIPDKPPKITGIRPDALPMLKARIAELEDAARAVTSERGRWATWSRSERSVVEAIDNLAKVLPEEAKQ